MTTRKPRPRHPTHGVRRSVVAIALAVLPVILPAAASGAPAHDDHITITVDIAPLPECEPAHESCDGVDPRPPDKLPGTGSNVPWVLPLAAIVLIVWGITLRARSRRPIP